MLFTPIRYINNGEALDQANLNKMGYDIQANLEEIISQLGASGLSSDVNETPNTVALRDENGTCKFSSPTLGEHPLRLNDATASNFPNTVVKRDNNGASLFDQVGVARAPTNDFEVANKKYVDDHVNNLRAMTFTIISGASYVSSYSNIVGKFDNDKNYFDILPPSGKVMSDLVAFIPSVYVIHFKGDVDGNDSFKCVYEAKSDRIRVWVQNTEQRSKPAANWLAVWRNS